jgi:ubiquitin conjugation factor E4 B
VVSEVESTGAHTQFYDKFNIRYEIFQVIKTIWTNDIYKQRLTQESKYVSVLREHFFRGLTCIRTNIEFFLRFVNLLLNDATYVLDEALTKFPKIHDLQAELRQPAGALTAEQRTAKEEELATTEGQAQSYMQLTNETVSMMSMFTKTLSASFTMPEIVDRVAAMVDYTLDTLVGPKSTNLKVDDPGKYSFHPKQLLGDFIDIFLNLGVSDNFVMAVARDGRSYKPATFDAASRLLQRLNIKSGDQVAQWENLKAKFKKAKEMDDQAEEDLGEIPEELLDPLLYSLMRDPVILPVSRTTVDRSTIRSHLLSDPHDPFNRSPLKIEDVVDDVEMKAKVDAFLVEMKAKAKALKQGSTAQEQIVGKEDMDTTEG